MNASLVNCACWLVAIHKVQVKAAMMMVANAAIAASYVFTNLPVHLT
jgi:hypothetical protein